MPAVNVAMQRSLDGGLRERFVQLLLASLRPGFQVERRGTISDISNQVSDVKTAFSSWDNCMQASYCKWPVIALIIIGGLIIFSVLWCIIRCACCGLSCCCECFQCLKCCGECCGCCTPPGGRKHKYLDEPFVPPNQGYKAPDPMNSYSARAVPTVPAVPPGGITASSTFPRSEPPQYAEFDVSKKSGDPDALPAMPSWEGAESKKIMVEHEEVEMDTLKKPEASGQGASLLGGMSPGPASPLPSPGPGARGPYGVQGANAASSGYFPPGASGAAQATAAASIAPSTAYSQFGTPNNDPYSQNGQGYGQQGSTYGQSSSTPLSQGHGASPVYGANQGYNANQGYGGSQTYGASGAYGSSGAYGAAAIGTRSQSPRVNNNGAYGQNQGHAGPPRQGTPGTPGRSRISGQTAGPASQGSYDSYGRSGQGSYDNYNQQTPGYGAGPQRSPQDGAFSQPQIQDRLKSPAPQAGYGYGGANYNRLAYGGSGPQRQYSTESTRPLARPSPQRQYTDMSAEPSPMNLQNTAGFDFTTGSSLPSMDQGSQVSQQPQQTAAYPGYKPYQPPSNW